LYFLIVFTHRFWLPLAADFLVLQNPPRQADLIVVATPFRPRFLYAFNLFKKGFANQILLVGDNRIKSPGSKATYSDLAKSEALNMGIPETKIHTRHSTGTRADALQAKNLMLSLSLKSAVIVSDPYNMRRLTMIFNHVFDGSGLHLSLISTDQKRESPDNWWLSPHSFVYVIKEWIKLPINFYLLNFRPAPQSVPQPVPEEKRVRTFTEPELEKDDLFSKKFTQSLWRLFKFKIGEFLVVEENEFNTNAVFTETLSAQVSSCYQKGICKKIFLFSGKLGYTQINLKQDKIQNDIKNKILKLGIDPNDLILVPHTLGDVYQTTRYLNQYMSQIKLKSASLFLPYYETRKFRFYFKRFLNPKFTVQIKPLESDYRHSLELWLQNTGLGNLFLDQYLIITHYYFNKILWSFDSQENF
jgi:uncharacterized SAM-binding protein YcdF (DUF218 family)